jgi:hypothetical protein
VPRRRESGGIPPPDVEVVIRAGGLNGLLSWFHFVVAVGFDESVGEVVAESAGLGDFGDAVGDEPGFVAVL